MINKQKQLYVGFRQSDFRDKLVVQITLPTGDLRNVFVCDMSSQQSLAEMETIFLQYQALDLDGTTVRKGPHGDCVMVRYILHDATGIITDVMLFHMTEEEFQAQLPRNQVKNQSLLN